MKNSVILTSVLTSLAFNLIWHSSFLFVIFWILAFWLGTAHAGRLVMKDKKGWSDTLYVAGPMALLAILIENNYEKTRSN